MKMTLPCSVVRDMLPLLADGLLSAESETILREHLKSCDACRKMFEEMTEPEIMTETDKLELDYLKKVRGRRNRLVATILLSVALVGGGVFVWLQAQAGKATVSYDEGSQTLVVYSNGEGKKLELPENIAQAQTLDAQYDSFRMAMYLPLLSEA
ncbi:MAG: zf-HC2 domain-containing protein, partial [Oscillospiraceae bacterium]|nr:zf-HC2 domain-containing protein [Oscillospiraceae bacterium]